MTKGFEIRKVAEKMNFGEALDRRPIIVAVAAIDNDDIATPFRRIAVFGNGRISFRTKNVPAWLKSVFP